MILKSERIQSYLVLLDFSEVSYTALKYVISIAKLTGAKIQLLHIVNSNEVIKGDNHIAELRSIKLEARRVEGKLKSIVEIITVEGVEADYHYSLGSLANEMEEQIALLSPNLVIVGRRKMNSIFSSEMMRYLLNVYTGPLLIVNKEMEFKNETKISLCYDDLTFKRYNPKTIFDLNQVTESSISLINIEENSSSKKKLELPTEWQCYFGQNYAIEHKENVSIGDSLSVYIEKEAVDLLCMGRGSFKGSFLNRIFSKNSALESIVNKVTIPIVILRN